jgi:hypothetical protein
MKVLIRQVVPLLIEIHFGLVLNLRLGTRRIEAARLRLGLRKALRIS